MGAGTTAEVKFGREIGRHPLVLAVSVVTGLLSTAGSLAVPLIIRLVIEDVASGRSVSLLVAGAFVVAILAAFAQGGSSYLLARIGSWMLYRVRTMVMGHVLRLPLQQIRAEGVGTLASRITTDALMLRQVIDVGLAQVPASLALVVASLAVMLWLSWPLTLVAAVAFAIVSVIILFVFRRIRANAIEQQVTLGALAGSFTAHLSAITMIKACRAEDAMSQDLAREADHVRRVGFTGDVLQASLLPVLAGGQQVALVAVILVGTVLMARGALSVASFAAFLLYLLQLATPVVMVFTGIGRLRVGQAVKDRFNALLAVPGEATDEAGTPPATQEGDSVVFDGVSYTYPGAGAPALDGLSLHVPSRGLTTIVGPSGAGKSTTLTLIERFADPDSGSIRFLGAALRAWPLRDLRSSIVYVDQSFTLLKSSVRQNLSVQRGRDVPEAELWGVLGAVGLAEQVRALPDGLDTVIGGQVDMSGGQRQRLALARILLSDAKLVLLDEPTSQLDGLSEDRFRAVIEVLAEDRAVLVVAHRLSTVRSAEHVIMLDAGKVVDEGTHPALLERCPAYRALHESQSLATTSTTHHVG